MGFFLFGFCLGSVLQIGVNYTLKRPVYYQLYKIPVKGLYIGVLLSTFHFIKLHTMELGMERHDKEEYLNKITKYILLKEGEHNVMKREIENVLSRVSIN